jgi:ataxia telangiectasia mutated family protein
VACIGEIGTSRSKNRKHARVYEKFALFAHRQYQAVMASPELIRLEVYIERKKNEIERLGGMRGPGISKQMKDSRALFEADSSQVQTQYDARDAFLVLAIEMYSRTLVSTDTADTECSIRLCSLWYKNFGRDEYGEPIHTAIARVPSHKFVFLAHQLTARLATTSMDSSRSQKTLWQLIRRICEEHPFHILLQLLALTRNEEKTSIGEASRSSPAIRQNAALELMSGLKVAGRKAEHIRDMERLTLACYKFASFPIKGMKEYESRTRKEFPVPTRQEIRTIQNLHVPVLTADTPIDISSRYDDIIYIQRFSDTFTTAGGVNMPKITDCIGSNGSRYKQLVSLRLHLEVYAQIVLV